MMRPVDLVLEARRMLEDGSRGTVSVWSRASALLCRQALENVLAELWLRTAPSVRWAPMRAQLHCLPAYLLDDELAGEVAFAWHALSRATHHHPYELDPTREELDSLLGTTARLIAAVDERGGPT